MSLAEDRYQLSTKAKTNKKPKTLSIEKMSKVTSTKVLSKKDDAMYDRHKLAELGVNPEFLKFMNDEQAKELLKSMLYLIIKKQDGYA